MTRLNLGAFDPCSRAMGPGSRAVVWARGCSVDCRGCVTPQLIPSEPATPVDVDALWDRIDRARLAHGLEGVSFSGGEPFEQAEALAEIARRAHRVGLSVLSWSGYARAFLEGDRAPHGSRALLAELDVLIDGPFVAARAGGGLALRGSSNQVTHFLTGRYDAGGLEPGRMKVELADDGRAVVSGVVDYAELNAVLSILGVTV